MLLPDIRTPVLIESYDLPTVGGFDRGLGLRAVKGQTFAPTLAIEGNKSLAMDYPSGTQFRVQAAMLKRTNGTDYLFTSWQWDVQVLDKRDD